MQYYLVVFKSSHSFLSGKWKFSGVVRTKSSKLPDKTEFRAAIKTKCGDRGWEDGREWLNWWGTKNVIKREYPLSVRAHRREFFRLDQRSESWSLFCSLKVVDRSGYKQNKRFWVLRCISSILTKGQRWSIYSFDHVDKVCCLPTALLEWGIIENTCRK